MASPEAPVGSAGAAKSTIAQKIESVPSSRLPIPTIRLWQVQSMWAAVPMSQKPAVSPAGSGRGATSLLCV